MNCGGILAEYARPRGVLHSAHVLVYFDMEL